MLGVRKHIENRIPSLPMQNLRAILCAKTSIISVLGAKPIVFCAEFLKRNDKRKENKKADSHSSSMWPFCSKKFQYSSH